VVVTLLALAGPLTARRLGAFAAITTIALAPVVAFSLATVGAPVPATAAAKVYGGLIGLLRGDHEPLVMTLALRPGMFLSEWIVWLTRSHWLLPLALPAVALAWKQRGRALGAPALALVLHPLAMALLAPYQPPSFQEGRYSIQLLPLAFVVLGIAVAGSSRLRRGVVLVTLLTLALPPLGLAAVRYGWAVQNINAMQVHLGRWVNEQLPADARLAVNDIGAIAYFSRRTVVDLSGLVTPDVIPYRRQGQEAIVRYVAEQCPDYVIIFPTWFPVLAARSDIIEPIYRVVLEHNQVSGAAEMVVYRMTRCTV
jgi:arabinofuranosyltransferase